MIGIKNYNISFFENFGVPAYLIRLTGKWDPGSDKLIENFLDTEVKKSENTHKTMILQMPTEGELIIDRLDVETREGSFRLFNQVWREEILTAHAMPPYRVGLAIVGTLGGNVATEMTEIYKQSVIDPHNRRLEHIWNEMIFKEGMGLEKFVMRYTKLDTRDLDTEVQRDVLLAEARAMSPNELREKYDIGPAYKGGDDYEPIGRSMGQKIQQKISTTKAVRAILKQMIEDGEISNMSNPQLVDGMTYVEMIDLLNDQR